MIEEENKKESRNKVEGVGIKVNRVQEVDQKGLVNQKVVIKEDPKTKIKIESEKKKIEREAEAERIEVNLKAKVEVKRRESTEIDEFIS